MNFVQFNFWGGSNHSEWIGKVIECALFSKHFTSAKLTDNKIPLLLLVVKGGLAEHFWQHVNIIKNFTNTSVN